MLNLAWALSVYAASPWAASHSPARGHRWYGRPYVGNTIRSLPMPIAILNVRPLPRGEGDGHWAYGHTGRPAPAEMEPWPASRQTGCAHAEIAQGPSPCTAALGMGTERMPDPARGGAPGVDRGRDGVVALWALGVWNTGLWALSVWALGRSWTRRFVPREAGALVIAPLPGRGQRVVSERSGYSTAETSPYARCPSGDHIPRRPEIE